MTFGEKLSEARKEKGLSQEELAKQIFVTRQALSRWENSTAQPSFEMLSVLCNILDKSPDFFMTEKDSRRATIRRWRAAKSDRCGKNGAQTTDITHSNAASFNFYSAWGSSC